MKQAIHPILIGTLLFTSHSKSNSSDRLENTIGENKYLQITQINFKNTYDLDPEILSRTYGYLKGQQFTLNRIKKEFSELENEVTKCELEFGLAFTKASERIHNELKNLMGDQFKKYETETTNRLASMLSTQKITKEIAVRFIEEVKQRAKGHIETPIFKTLLTYQYIDNPSKEFLMGFTNPYSTKNHPKTKGVTINAKLPLSWNQQEGDRPNVIQKFISENGKGQEIILFMVKDLGLSNDYKITQEELNDFFSENELKRMIPEEGEFISAKRIVIDNHTGGQLIFKTTQQRLDLSITMQSAQFITIHNGKMIFLQCMVSTKEGENLTDKFNLFMPLFRQVANSIVLIDQY